MQGSRATTLAIAMTLAVSLCACSSKQGSSVANSTPIVIGIDGPLTGAQAQAGDELVKGAQIRVDEINKSGGLLGRQVQLSKCDDMATPQSGILCATQLVDQTKVVGLVMGVNSPVITVERSVTEKAKVPAVQGGVSKATCDG